jgi:predicted DNA-binding transcriptional regulator AlpA
MQRPYLNIEELFELFGMKKTSLLNSISDERFCCPTYKLGRQRVADRKVVEAYFEARRSEGLDQLTTLS